MDPERIDENIKNLTEEYNSIEEFSSDLSITHAPPFGSEFEYIDRLYNGAKNNKEIYVPELIDLLKNDQKTNIILRFEPYRPHKKTPNRKYNLTVSSISRYVLVWVVGGQPKSTLVYDYRKVDTYHKAWKAWRDWWKKNKSRKPEEYSQDPEWISIGE